MSTVYLILAISYAIFGSSSAVLIKSSGDFVLARQYRMAIFRFAAASILFLAGLTCLFVLLRDLPLSILVPVAVGLNLALTSIGAWLFLRENFSLKAAIGNALIIVGVLLIMSDV